MADGRVIEFTVLGTPAPKGSSRAMLRGGAAVNVPSGSSANKAALADWGSAVRSACASAVGIVTEPPFVRVPLRVKISFRLRRPGGHYHKKTGKLLPAAPVWPSGKPDISKLLRATEDAITGIAYDDDSRIVESFVRKVYALPGQEGAWIRIEVAP